VDGLMRWTQIFGQGYCGLLVFVYRLVGAASVPDEIGELWTWRGQRFVLRGVPIQEYRQAMRVRSPRWGTVDLPARLYRDLARPMHHFIHEYRPDPDEVPF
jgi:hypothetical protein